MLLSITANSTSASDLSFLLHKHPDRFQSFNLSFGRAHVFYPEVSDHRCTACVMLDVDPVGMAKKNRGAGGHLAGHVNDRPFVSSSFMSTAISAVLGSAMAGRCKDRPAAVGQAMDLSVKIESLPVKGGETFLRSLFEPLGYEVQAENQMLDEQFPDWGDSPYYSVTLRATHTLSQVLTHLYVLMPVFDNQKHYFVGNDEIEKLFSKGEGWLATHPCKEAISRRYLRHQGGMVRQALKSLQIVDEVTEAEESHGADVAEQVLERTVSLNQQRYEDVVAALVNVGASRVIDLGCGEGKLLKRLLGKKRFTEIVGMDVSARALEIAARRLRIESLPSFQTERIRLMHGSLMYRDKRIAGFDAACLIEVIEHLDPPRLKSLRRVVFEYARPTTVIVTTPNAEYNVVWESLPAGKFRHVDHRFEWTRAEFQSWANQIATDFGYQVRFAGIGEEATDVGTPTQMAVFEKVMAGE